MGDKIVISKIELLYGRLFQIDLHNESKDEWYRVFADKDELYTMLKNVEKSGEWGKCLGYTTTPCPNCGRYRLERYENSKEVCEKCGWCPQEKRYIDRENMYPIEENEIL